MNTCAECGGTVALTTTAGRTASYRGMTGLKVPDDLAIPTCQGCRAEWLDGPMIDVLEAILAPQHAERASVTCAACHRVIVALEDHHGWCVEGLKQLAAAGDTRPAT